VLKYKYYSTIQFSKHLNLEVCESSIKVQESGINSFNISIRNLDNLLQAQLKNSKLFNGSEIIISVILLKD